MNKAFIFIAIFLLPTFTAMACVNGYITFSALYLAAFFFISLPFILNHTRYLKWLIPFAVLVPVACYYNIQYHSEINKNLISILLETNLSEIKGYLGENYIIPIALYLALYVGLCLYFIFGRDENLKISKRMRIILLAANIGIISIVTVNDHIKNKLDTLNDQSSQKVNFDLGLDKPSNDFLLIYPFNVFDQLHRWHLEKQKMMQQFEKNKTFKFNAKSHNDPNANEIVVLVIGETSQADHWQFGGYSRQTTPLLAKQKNLNYFRDATATSSVTMMAVPQMITRKSSAHVTSILFNERSVISAFKEAGFKTYWLSTQQKFGKTDTSTSIYIKEADVQRFLNPSDYHSRGKYDDVLINELAALVNDDPAKKKFIVLHTLGSHAIYGDRYPDLFEQFKPTPRQTTGYIPTSRKFKDQTINSYDNTILYTDYVINSFVETIKSKTDTSAFLLYASDHGEQLFTGKCDKYLHGNTTEAEFKIPLLTWHSQMYQLNHPNIVRDLQANANKPIDQTSVFPTLLNMANITIANDGYVRSLANPNLPKYDRIIYGALDFDKSKRKGVCRELSN